MKLDFNKIRYWRKKDGCELLVICGLNLTTGMAIIDDDSGLTHDNQISIDELTRDYEPDQRSPVPPCNQRQLRNR